MPLGEDLCHHLKAGLESRTTAWNIIGAVEEDSGAVLKLCRGNDVFTVTTSWQGENEWALVLAQPLGCIGWLLDRLPDTQAQKAIREIKILINKIVLADPERFTNVTWISNDDS
ncbi:hypothetical protein [Schlesneria sp. DSM 10557]|uniref:hypothetical protein n=1 Tax=Schlesneria sp. DSM 10557 TaxID=3044399 RepID=UPI0035A0877F